MNQIKFNKMARKWAYNTHCLLVLSDFSEGNSSWSVSVGLLDSTSDSGLGALGRLLVSLSWDLGAGSLSSGGLSSGHCEFIIE